MQFIDGPTLADLIDELRELTVDGNGRNGESSPALAAIAKDRTPQSPHFCRAVARLGIQAAEALDYAHTSGVVHRDNVFADAPVGTDSPDFRDLVPLLFTPEEIARLANSAEHADLVSSTTTP